MNDLNNIALNVRRNVVKMVHAANSGHPGGSLSVTDILVALYFNVANITEENVDDVCRDKIILSKGHCSPALYSVLAEKGFIPKDSLLTFRQINSNLQGHPTFYTRGVDMSTGSLGQGLSVGVGMSLANRLDNNGFRTYVVCGDGESQEGQIWEAAMAAGHYKLDNLLMILDHNHLQIDGNNDDVMTVNPLGKKFEAFGWNVYAVDGHDIEAITEACKMAETVKGKPTAIIAETIKGKGVSFMENQAGWHGKAPNDAELAIALKDLGEE